MVRFSVNSATITTWSQARALCKADPSKDAWFAYLDEDGDLCRLTNDITWVEFLANKTTIHRFIASPTRSSGDGVKARAARGSDGVAPYNTLVPVGFQSVSWAGGFWGDRAKLMHHNSIAALKVALENPQNGANINNFVAIAAGDKEAKWLGANWVCRPLFFS